MAIGQLELTWHKGVKLKFIQPYKFGPGQTQLKQRSLELEHAIDTHTTLFYSCKCISHLVTYALGV